jgi:hypothetical protein
MSPTATITKPIAVKFTGATTNDPVKVENLTTGEIIKTRADGSLMRLESKEKGILFDCANFTSGWSVGDKVRVTLGGSKAGLVILTLTAATNAPQTSTVTAVAASTAVLSI